MNLPNRDRFEKFVEEEFDMPANELKLLRTTDDYGVEGYKGLPSHIADTLASCMLISWKAAKEDNWKAEGTVDYDTSIHSNPDHYAWADFFIATFPNCGVDRDTLAGWFANAMMARHDYDRSE